MVGQNHEIFMFLKLCYIYTILKGLERKLDYIESLEKDGIASIEAL